MKRRVNIGPAKSQPGRGTGGVWRWGSVCPGETGRSRDVTEAGSVGRDLPVPVTRFVFDFIIVSLSQFSEAVSTEPRGPEEETEPCLQE